MKIATKYTYFLVEKLTAEDLFTDGDVNKIEDQAESDVTGHNNHNNDKYKF